MIGTRRAPATAAGGQENVTMATVQPLKSSIDRQSEQLMLIDGERVRAVSGNTINFFHPSTGRLIGDGPPKSSTPTCRRRL
jgi:hypothetical protein